MRLNNALEQLNQAPHEIAESRFLDCCGSQAWARRMTEGRPFETVPALIEKAEQIWWNLAAEDWLEAFAAHPKIGARKAAPAQQAQSARWSHGEQAGTHTAAGSVLDELAEANRLYDEKFGYIFIVCATGKSADEMLGICRQRLSNKADLELLIAAEEQSKITEIRLKKLVHGEI